MVFRIITKNISGRITKNPIIVGLPPEPSPFYPALPYSALDDAELLEPGAYDIEDVFIPATSNYAEQIFQIHFNYGSGTLIFSSISAGQAGDIVTLNYSSSGLNLPVGLFFSPWDDRGFTSFVFNPAYDGLKTIVFSKNANGDGLGGQIRYSFKDALFNDGIISSGANSWDIIEIYQNGSCYLRNWNNLTQVLGDPVLFCRWDGILYGPPQITDIPRPMISSLPASPYETLGDGFLNNPGRNIDDLPLKSMQNFLPMLSYNLDADWGFNVSINNLISYQYKAPGSPITALTTYQYFPGGSNEGDREELTSLSGLTLGWVWGIHDGIYSSLEGNGLKRFFLAKTDDEDGLGGFFDYYFHQAAWTYAAGIYDAGPSEEPTNWSVLEVYQNGSVYVRDYNNPSTPAILVVRWDGEVGPGGSATPDVTEDTIRPI